MSITPLTFDDIVEASKANPKKKAKKTIRPKVPKKKTKKQLIFDEEMQRLNDYLIGTNK